MHILGHNLYTRPTLLHALLERVINPGQKLWQTVLGEEFSCSQLLFNMHSEWPNFSPLEGVWGSISFGFWHSHKFPVVPSYVPQVLNVFPRHVPNSPTLYSIICAQSWTFITYKGGPKGITSRLNAQCLKKKYGEPIKVTPCPPPPQKNTTTTTTTTLGAVPHLLTHPQTNYYNEQ